jgi:rhodanese-related sulfurtransferase
MVTDHKTLLDDARREIEELTPADAMTRVGRADTVFVDLRDWLEIERDGAVPGAFHMPRGNLEFWIDPTSPYHKPVFASGKRFVFYCSAGWRSALATQAAQRMGLAPVCHVAGGFGAWREAGGPVESATARKEQETKEKTS